MSGFRVPVARPTLPTIDAVVPYLQQMYDAHRFSNFGPLNEQLERRLANHFGVKPDCVVTCSSATTGLTGSIFLSSERVFAVPSFTFPATPLAVVSARKDLVFHDVDESDWRIRLATAKANLGVVDVLPFGTSVSTNERSGFRTVIFDAAASIGSIPADGIQLEEDWAAVFSLHATKVLGIGEGGVVVFGSQRKAKEFRSWTNFGFAGHRTSTLHGTNAKLSEIGAAFGLAALDGFSVELEEWKSSNSRGSAILEKIGVSERPKEENEVSPYLIATFPDNRTTRRAKQALGEKGVETREWWPIGCHKMKAFRGQPQENLPITDMLTQTVLGLPMYRRMSSTDFELVSEGLTEGIA